VNTLCFQDQSS